MTANDITQVQIIATTKDGKHLISISDKKTLIWQIVANCQFVKLKDELFVPCSLKELMEE